MKIFRLTCGFLLPTCAQIAGSGWANDELLWHCKNMQGRAQSAAWLAKIMCVCLERGEKKKKKKEQVRWCQPKHEKWPSLLQGSHHPTNQLHAEAQEQSGCEPAHNPGVCCCVSKCPGERRLWGALVRGGEAPGPLWGSFNFHSLLHGGIWQLTQPVQTKRQRHLTLCWEDTGIWYMWDKLSTPERFSCKDFWCSPWLVTSHIQDLQFCLSEDCETELLSSLIRNQANPALVFWLQEKNLI